MAAMAVLSTRKRGLSSLLDDPHHTCDPSSKRICFSSRYSPPPSDCFAPPLPSTSALPGGDRHGSVAAAEREDIDSVIWTPHSLLSIAVQSVVSGGEQLVQSQSFTAEKLPTDVPGWVEFFVTEMMAASNMEDAKARASKVLGFLKKSTITHSAVDAAQIADENKMMREQVDSLLRDNSVLKRAVVIQHERKKDYDLGSQELQHLRQTVSQYQEKIRTLEVSNYGLAVHLKLALQDNSVPGC